jgi:hypothetical protein
VETELTKMLLDIKGTGDSTNTLLQSHIEAFNRHVEDDAKLAGRISNLEASQQRQGGFIAGVMAICTAIGSGIALFITWLVRGH